MCQWCQLVRSRPAVEQPTSDAVIDEMVSKVDSSITEEIKERLQQLLRKYSSVMSLHELDLISAGRIW